MFVPPTDFVEPDLLSLSGQSISLKLKSPRTWTERSFLPLWWVLMKSSCSLNSWNSSLVLPGGRYQLATKWELLFANTFTQTDSESFSSSVIGICEMSLWTSNMTPPPWIVLSYMYTTIPSTLPVSELLLVTRQNDNHTHFKHRIPHEIYAWIGDEISQLLPSVQFCILPGAVHAFSHTRPVEVIPNWKYLQINFSLSDPVWQWLLYDPTENCMTGPWPVLQSHTSNKDMTSLTNSKIK